VRFCLGGKSTYSFSAVLKLLCEPFFAVQASTNSFPLIFIASISDRCFSLSSNEKQGYLVAFSFK